MPKDSKDTPQPVSMGGPLQDQQHSCTYSLDILSHWPGVGGSPTGKGEEELVSLGGVWGMGFSIECKIFPSMILFPGVGGSQPAVPKLEANLEGEGWGCGEEEGWMVASELSLKEIPLTTLQRQCITGRISWGCPMNNTLQRQRITKRVRWFVVYQVPCKFLEPQSMGKSACPCENYQRRLLFVTSRHHHIFWLGWGCSSGCRTWDLWVGTPQIKLQTVDPVFPQRHGGLLTLAKLAILVPWECLGRPCRPTIL